MLQPKSLLLALTALALALNSAGAQNQGDKTSDTARQAVAFPTGNRDTSVLLIESTAPSKVRVNEEYTYELRVTNIAKNLAVEHVQIQQRQAGDVDIIKIESSDHGEKSSQSDKNGKKQDQNKQQKSNQEQKTWSISRLMPGETKTAHVTAVGNSQGTANTCLSVDYRTAVCLAVDIVKPELAITKTAPAQTDICGTIKYQYTIKNEGSGATKEITLTDKLPDGTHTTDGKQEVTFTIPSLGPNQSRDFSAEIISTRAGTIGSRAEAKTAGGLTARSNQPTTKVIEPKLVVQADGPDVATVGEQVTYQVTVKNQGDAVAQDTRLAVEVPKGFDVLGASENVRDDMGKAKELTGEAVRAFMLGDLKPGDQEKFWIRTVAREPGKQLGYNFLAASQCDRERKDRKFAQQTVRTEVIAIPALALTTVDMKDPVQSGEEVTYRIVVANQGSAAAKNVKLVATLPAEFKFDKAGGGSSAQADGNKVTFDPIPSIDPNDKVEWHLTAKANKVGQVRLRTEVTSDRIKQPGVSMEPTTIYGGQQHEETARKPQDTETK